MQSFCPVNLMSFMENSKPPSPASRVQEKYESTRPL
jgi:hypothetical protein